MDSLSPYLVWIVIGLLLLGVELMTTTFVMMFFAIGAFVVAGMTWAGLVDSVVMQLILFGGLSAAGLLLFKEKLKTAWRHRSHNSYRVDAGEVLLLDTPIAIGAQAEVNYQGTKWTAVNESGLAMLAGERAVIGRVDGVKLILTGKKEQQK